MTDVVIYNIMRGFIGRGEVYVVAVTIFSLLGFAVSAAPVDAGECKGSIGNTVWYDDNGNGIQDGEEMGIEGLKIKLIDGNDVEEAYTNSKGHYKHDEYCAGDYTIVVHRDHILDGCYIVSDPDGELDNTTRVILDGDHDDHTKADFGFRCPAGTVAPSTGPGAGIALLSAGLAAAVLVIYKLMIHGHITRQIKNKSLANTVAK